MSNQQFSLGDLIPKFEPLLQGQWDTSAGLSALFVTFLLAVATVFAIDLTIKFIRSKIKINFYRNLIGELTPQNLADQRQDIYKKALESVPHGNLWKEFDESLVWAADRSRVFNTLDAAHFFNTHNLARNITENRLLAAIPGFLTAIGVIGTFAGLTLGLSKLHLEAGATVEVLRDGIGNMIAGAAVAFITSVWGVFSSVIFNVYEKLLERNVRQQIAALQNRVDYLYPRINAEQSLVSIADNSKSSNETLLGLAEKIGDKMQEALSQASDTIRTGLEDSLNEIMRPAIQSLVDNAKQGSEQALESMLEKFLDGVGAAGNSQKAMMENASADVKEAVSNMSGQLTDFVQKLEAQSAAAEQQASNQRRLIEEQINSLSESSAEQQRRLSDQFESLTASMGEQIKHHQAESERREAERQSAFTNEMNSFGQNQNNLMDQVNGMTDRQDSLFKDVLGQLADVKGGFSELIDGHRSAGAEVMQAAQQINGASSQFESLSNNLKLVVDKLGKDIQSAVAASQELSTQNQQISQDMRSVMEGYQQLKERMDQVVDKLRDATQHAETGFTAVDRHLQSFQEGLTAHVEELELQVSKLLNDYSLEVNRQTEHRLGEWNTQTARYTKAMTDVTEAMSGIVDEIETKVGA